MNGRDALLFGFAALVVGALVTLVLARARRLAGWLAFAATALAGGLATLTAARVLAGAPAVDVTFFGPVGGSLLRVYVDGLSAIFLLLIALISVLAALYSIRYMDHYRDYGVARYYPSFLLFVAGMYGIVTTTDLMVFFCLFWQLMTIPSFLLVRYEYRQPSNVRAAWRYLVMMEISCLLVMGGAALLAGTGPERYDFDQLAATLTQALGASPALGGATLAAFALFLVGFGIKAGMWPFGQMWLPDAHPAAPSPVSALLSGVMIKTGVYGLMRTFLWLVPAEAAGVFPTGAWGLVIATLGTITLFIGTMQALKQEQSKRLLAFHSIGQVGYILLGLGACLALVKPGIDRPAVMGLAALAFFGALFHTLNHGTFKGLLFLNAGSMLAATDTQDLNRMGGLMRYMPWTALTCLVASFSIAGVPGFNGFASKWSVYVATLLGSRAEAYLALFGLVAILTSALTLASFMKFFGMAFLARTSQLVREKAAGRRLEVGALMQVPQLLLALVCLLFGLVPGLAVRLLDAVLVTSSQATLSQESGTRCLAAALAGARAETAVAGPLGGVASGAEALLSPVVFALVLGLLLGLAYVVSRLGGAERRAADSWMCGYATEAESNRYRAHGMYGEFKRYFGWVGGMAAHGGDGHASTGAAGSQAGKVS